MQHVDAIAMPRKGHVGKESHMGLFFIQPVHDIASNVSMERVTWQPIKMTWHP